MTSGKNRRARFTKVASETAPSEHLVSHPRQPHSEPVEAPALADGDELIDESPIADQQSSAASEEARFPCAQCGAQLAWDPQADAMLCAYCSHRVDVPRGEGTILERPLAEAGIAARGLGVERRVVRCDTCGATVSFDEAATATSCVYCGSGKVLVQDANRNAIRPESLVPLGVGRAFVDEAFIRWVRSLWFRPNKLRDARHSEAFGVYIPFWTFDCGVRSEWSADAGHYYYVQQSYWTTINGRRVRQTRTVRKVRWVPKWGQRDDAYDDLLIPASGGLSHDLLAQLGRFDTSKLVPYRPEYLAGWRAEEYRVDLETGWASARQRIEEEQRRRCAGDVPGDTHRRLEVRNTIRDPHWKHVLLPLWVIRYSFGGRPYHAMIHGQTGHIVGTAPYSWIKITLFVLGLIVVAGVVLVIWLATR